MTGCTAVPAPVGPFEGAWQGSERALAVVGGVVVGNQGRGLLLIVSMHGLAPVVVVHAVVLVLVATADVVVVVVVAAA